MAGRSGHIRASTQAATRLPLGMPEQLRRCYNNRYARQSWEGLMARHPWQFVGTQIGSLDPRYELPIVSAVCQECGEARSTRALLVPPYEKVDLSGQCPGHPDGQETRSASVGGEG